jgi:hypothetical protein
VSRPRVIDCFPFNNELELLECRLTELYDAVDTFVLVEAQQDHQGHQKPLYYADNQDRFEAWADKLVHVVCGDLPTVAEDPGPWAREHAQREWIMVGLAELDLDAEDIILQSDVDEIPTAVAARNVRPRGAESIAFHQRGHFWAVDWLYPPGWNGTVARRLGTIDSFTQMRDTRNFANRLDNAGWHLSWLGGPEAALRKVGSFCHPEVEPRIRANAVDSDRYWREGIHVDGVKMVAVDVDRSWPKWIQDRTNVPANWYRPR